MDRELHFPHTMLSGSRRIDRTMPGMLQHAVFDASKASGWHHAHDEARQAVLVASDKVRFIVTCSRRDGGDTVRSTHGNRWIVTLVNHRWGIAPRSC